MSRRRLAGVGLLLLLAAVVLGPRLVVGASAALFSDTQSATSNVVTAGTCTGTTYQSWLTSTANIPSSSRSVYNRLSGTTALSSDSWMSSGTWTSSNVSPNQSGALYCDSNAALAITTAAGHAETAAVTQGTLGITASGGSTVLFWVKTTSTTAGILTALGNTGTSSNNDRVVSMSSTGLVSFSARSGGTSSSWTITGSSAVNDGSWHMVVVRMGGYTNGGATLYVDGVEEATRGVSGTTYGFRNFGSTRIAWTLGDQNAVTTPTNAPTVAVVGNFDEFVVIDTINLSATQVATLYANADR